MARVHACCAALRCAGSVAAALVACASAAPRQRRRHGWTPRRCPSHAAAPHDRVKAAGPRSPTAGERRSPARRAACADEAQRLHKRQRQRRDHSHRCFTAEDRSTAARAPPGGRGEQRPPQPIPQRQDGAEVAIMVLRIVAVMDLVLGWAHQPPFDSRAIRDRTCEWRRLAPSSVQTSSRASTPRISPAVEPATKNAS